MRRISISLLAALLGAALPVSTSAQATTAQAGAAAAPAVARARWPAPLKGDGTVEIIQGQPRRVGNDMVTVLKIRNTSSAPLALLTVEEFWYNAQRQPVSGDTQRHKQLIDPGAIVEITTRSPWKADMSLNQYTFKHANGKIMPKAVKKFSE